MGVKDVTIHKYDYIKNPRIVLLDSSLKYEKGASEADIEVIQEDFTQILQMEEEYIH